MDRAAAPENIGPKDPVVITRTAFAREGDQAALRWEKLEIV